MMRSWPRDDIVATRIRDRQERMEAQERRLALEKSIHYHVGRVLGRNFSQPALIELADLLVAAQTAFGVPNPETFIRELIEHEPIRQRPRTGV